VVERRSSEVLSTYQYLTDDGPVHHTASTFVELSLKHVLKIDMLWLIF